MGDKKPSIRLYVNRVAEDALFMVGEAEDFLVSQERKTLDIIDKVSEGRMTPVAARLAVGLDYRQAHKDLEEWRLRLAGDARETGFPHLHPQLAFRIVQPLPQETA